MTVKRPLSSSTESCEAVATPFFEASRDDSEPELPTIFSQASRSDNAPFTMLSHFVFKSLTSSVVIPPSLSFALAKSFFSCILRNYQQSPEKKHPYP